MKHIAARLGVLLTSAVGMLACSASSSGDGPNGPADTSGSAGAGAWAPDGSGGDINIGGSGSGGADVCVENVDVVFVLDVSSSMLFVLNQLSSDIEAVVQAAAALGDGAPHFGLVAFVDNAFLDTGGALPGGTAHADATTLQASFQHYASTYTAFDRNPGDGPSGPTQQNPICEENANDALHMAATDFPWRDDATHVIILATDDTFLERPDNYGDRDGDGLTDKTDFPREGDYPAEWTMAETVDALRARDIRVFSFTRLQAPGPLDFTRCSTGRRLAWEAISDGWSTPYAGQPPIPEATSGRNYDLDAVKNGALSLAETINEVVVESNCNPVPN